MSRSESCLYARVGVSESERAHSRMLVRVQECGFIFKDASLRTRVTKASMT